MYSMPLSISVSITDRESLNYRWTYQQDPLQAERQILERRINDIDALSADSRLKKIDPEAYTRRLSRSLAEKKHGSGIIPLGMWDIDLDERHEEIEYEVSLPSGFKGYRAFAIRNFYTWTWNGYVIMPDDHSLRDLAKKVDDLFMLHDKISPAPQECTYLSKGTFGWDHTRSYECCPVTRRSDTPPNKTGYIDFQGISNECVEVAYWLKSVDVSLKKAEKSKKQTCSCGECAGCIYDTINDCCGELECDCRDCRPNRKRYTLPEGSHDCRYCDFTSCNCYGCTACIEARLENSRQVKMMINEARALNMMIWSFPHPMTKMPVTEAPVTKMPVTEAPVTKMPVTEVPVTKMPVTEVPVTEVPVTEVPDESNEWTVVRSRRKRRY